jgi:hypothetical protein
MRLGRAHLLVASFVAVSLLALPRTTQAAWPHNPGVNLPVCTATADQSYQVICLDGAGGAIVAWQDNRAGNLDIYTQHILASGTVDPAWPVNGRGLCTNGLEQSIPAIAPDGNGGAIITWQDHRSGNYDVYAHHVLKTGVVDPAWPVDGRALCAAANDQSLVTIASDGAGGAIVSWQDNRSGIQDIYAQHVLVSGAVDAAWPVDGRLLCIAAGNQAFPKIVSDGSGGAIVTWVDPRALTDDIYAQHVLASGAPDPAWPADGRAICSASNAQGNPAIVSDGTAGAIITWNDTRSGTSSDIFAQHVFAIGTVDPAWPANGRALCAAASDQDTPVIVADGGGGAIVAWEDLRGASRDIYAQHILPSGIADPAWPVDGRALCSAAGGQFLPAIAGDGSGGAIVTWYDQRFSTAADVYAQHVSISGAVDTGWPTDGRAVCTAPGLQGAVLIISDGQSGAIVGWQDGRSGGFDIFEQRVDRYGYLGTTEPAIASVADVPNDQGGRVRLNWDASWLDFESPQLVDHYWIFRQAPAGLATAMIGRGASLMSAAADTPLPGQPAFLRVGDGINASYWEFLGTQSALHFIQGYSYLAATTCDSVAGFNPRTQFMVMALDAANTKSWASPPDSGYSTDDLAPATPAPFAGEYTSAVTHLHWGRNSEADLAGYRLYRGTSPGFVPGAGNRIASPPDTGYADAAGAPYFYKLSAVDSHGNESGFALLQPSGTTDVAGGGAEALAFAAPWPNPARDVATLRFTLEREARVRLAVYDAGGREVRVLADGTRGAGAHVVIWDLAGERGEPVPSGLYFVRLGTPGQAMVRRVAVMR